MVLTKISNLLVKPFTTTQSKNLLIIMKAILIGDARFTKANYISASQLYPFFDNRKKLAKDLDLTFQHFSATTFSDIETIGLNNRADMFFIRPDWQESPGEAERVMGKLRQTHPDAKIFFIDPFDQISSTFFSVLPYVDRFLKYQALKDITQYHQPMIGGTRITDYLARQMDYDLEGWEVTSPIPEGYENRIEAGWFISLIPEFKRPLLRQPWPWEHQNKDIDMVCHVSYGPKAHLEWYGKLRMQAIEAVKALGDRYTLAISGEYLEERTVSRRQYLRDMKRGRIAISPFGWGELSLRDYEAVCHNCLLIKPSVDHIATEPNIFIAGETYVPVRWDYADLEEKCDYYLTHPEAADRIIQNARNVFINYFRRDGFVRRMANLLSTAQPDGSPMPSLSPVYRQN